MSKWHYICEEDVVFNGNDPRTGKYFCYHVDTFDNLLNNNGWVAANDAWDELNWILDQLDKRLESNDGTFIFIPTIGTATKIDNYYNLEDINYVAKHMIVSTE